jgi:hypothetical protein
MVGFIDPRLGIERFKLTTARLTSSDKDKTYLPPAIDLADRQHLSDLTSAAMRSWPRQRSLLVTPDKDNDNQDHDQHNQDADQRSAMRMVVIKAAKSFDEHGRRQSGVSKPRSLRYGCGDGVASISPVGKRLHVSHSCIAAQMLVATTTGAHDGRVGPFGPWDIAQFSTHRQPTGFSSSPNPHHNVPVQTALIVPPSSSNTCVVKANGGGGSAAGVHAGRRGNRST